MQQSNVLQEVITDHLVTKEDLKIETYALKEELRAETSTLRNEIKELEIRLTNFMVKLAFGTVASTGTITGIMLGISHFLK